MSKHNKQKLEKAARNLLYADKFKDEEKTSKKQLRKQRILAREDRWLAAYAAKEVKANPSFKWPDR